MFEFHFHPSLQDLEVTFHIKPLITFLFNFPFHMMQNGSFCIFLLLSPLLFIVCDILSWYVNPPSIQISLLKDNYTNAIPTEGLLWKNSDSHM